MDDPLNFLIPAGEPGMDAPVAPFREPESGTPATPGLSAYPAPSAPPTQDQRLPILSRIIVAEDKIVLCPHLEAKAHEIALRAVDQRSLAFRFE
jgi:hypothetical protein